MLMYLFGKKRKFLELENDPVKRRILYRVYACRFDNQVPNEKLVLKYFVLSRLRDI